MNFTTFLAKCIEASVDKHIIVDKYADFDISDALEKNHSGNNQEISAFVAAQYILLAGSVIAEDFFQGTSTDWASNKWLLWAERLKELEEKGLSQETKAAVIKARAVMISLRPELFSLSQGGTKVEG